jgi:hypothetical protein
MKKDHVAHAFVPLHHISKCGVYRWVRVAWIVDPSRARCKSCEKLLEQQKANRDEQEKG